MKRVCVLFITMVMLTGCKAKEDIEIDTIETDVLESSSESDGVEETEDNKAAIEEEEENPESAETTEPIEESTSERSSEEEDGLKLCVGFAKEVFEQTNAERVAAGLPELEWSDELAEAADIRAEEIIDCFSHVRPDGTKCYALGDRIHGENIARGPHADGYEFVERWMASPGHKANILCEVYTIMGVGTRHTEQGDTGVQLFGF